MKKKLYKIVFILCFCFGWWGLLYPEFTYNSDTIKAFSRIDGQELPFEYRQFLQADDEEIKVESRLFSLITKKIVKQE